MRISDFIFVVAGISCVLLLSFLIAQIVVGLQFKLLLF